MTKPSLFAILSNKPVQSTSAGEGVVPAADLVIRHIQGALEKYNVGILSNLQYFAYVLIKREEVIALKQMQIFQRVISGSKHPVLGYKDFTFTPLFKTLENLKHGSLTLYNILDPENNKPGSKITDRILAEIKEAVACGFQDELMQYYMQGVSAYPNMGRLQIMPLDQEGIIALNMCPDSVTYLLVESRLSQLRLRFDPPIKKLKDFFSSCLEEAKSLDAVERCINYILSYQNTGGGVSLVNVLNYTDINSLTSSSSWLAIPAIRNIVLQIVKCSNDPVPLRIKSAQKFNDEKVSKELKSGLDIICKLGIFHEYLPLFQKLLLTPFGQTIQFVQIFKSDHVLFCNLIKLMPWESGLQKLLYSNFCLEDYQVIHHILMHERCVDIFKTIAKYCSVESLLALADLHMSKWDDTIPISICDELADAEFCFIVLYRMQKEGKLSQIDRDTIMQYCVRAFEQEAVLSIIYILQQCDIKAFLSKSTYVAEALEAITIGSYIFSGKYENGKDVLRIICDIASPEEIMEFIWAGRAFDNQLEGSLDDSSLMSGSSTDDREAFLMIVGENDSI